MSTDSNSATPADPGLESLVTLLHFQGVAADREQIRHRLGTTKIGAPEMLRCAKDLGLKARACRSDWSRLAKTPLPAIAALRDGGFMVIAKAGEDKVLVQYSAYGAARPDDAGRTACALGRRTDLDGPPGRTVGDDPPLRHHLVHGGDPQIPASAERSAGGLVLPANVRFGLAAVLPGGDRQGSGASRPEHAGRADHRPAGDLGFRNCSGNPADLSLRAHHQPHRRRARRAPVSSFAGIADGLFPGAPRRRFGGAGARTGEHPQFSHQFGADPRHRSVFYVRVPGGDVSVLASCSPSSCSAPFRSTSGFRWG